MTEPTLPPAAPPAPPPPDMLTLVEKTAFLKSVEALASVPTEALAQLAARSHEVLLDTGEAVFREGDEARGAFLVIEGEIELRRAGEPVRRLGPRMAFGELFVERREPHPFTAVAVAPCTLLQLQSQDVLDCLVEFPEFAVAVVRVLAERNYRLTEQALTMESRIAALEARLREAGLADGPPPARRRRRPFGGRAG